MDIFSFITLIGGLAFFLYGMNVLSSGLERVAGGKLETYLKTMTRSPLRCLALGAGITAAIQSSSAVTVMLVGLVNSGIMTIRQSIGVIMGSNIGTTMTAWILTLVGIESSNVFISLLKPENFSLIFAFVGVLMIMSSKNDKRKDIGSILVGFAILMYGMKLMSAAVKPLTAVPEFTQLLVAFKNPILGVLVGLLITAVIQSSSASVGILQAFAVNGVISYGAAIPIIMGQNIGTCVTALLSSIGVSKNAKKVAVVHVSFNLIGTVVCLSLYCLGNALFHFTFTDLAIDAVGIAIVHTAFNILTTMMLLPFMKQLEALANKILPDDEDKKTKLLDKRLLATPSVALVECNNLADQMCSMCSTAVNRCIDILFHPDKDKIKPIFDNESMIDTYEDQLGSYLVLLSEKQLIEKDSLNVSRILHCINDFERIGDHALNITKIAMQMENSTKVFSAAAQHELLVTTQAIQEIVDLTEKAYLNDDIETAMHIEPLEQTIDELIMVVKSNHITRLQKGECSIELGLELNEILANFERISDHCSNIAVAMIELSHRSFKTHAFLGQMRREDEQFKLDRMLYSNRYQL